MSRSISKLFLLLSVVVFLAGVFSSCTKEAWLGSDKKAVYKAEVENLWPEKEAIRFEKKDNLVWNNVKFTLNSKYVYEFEKVPADLKEFRIDYKDFKNAKTGESFDPRETKKFVLTIIGDEGYWY